ncbi:7tm odorant receptor domain-containing protein [Phthorimaea operculella]|nr:7tm odorant receptor domain-containing protein [Phthorimaea operculella]
MHRNKKPSQRVDTVISSIEGTFRRFGLGAKPNQGCFWLSQIARGCFVALIITQIVAVFMSTGNTEKFFECFSTLTFCSMGALKEKSLRSKHKQWSHLLTQLDNLELKQLSHERSGEDYESDGEDTDYCIKTYINTYTEKFRSLSARVFRVYSFTCIIFVFSPFIELLYWRIVSGVTVSKPHVLPAWTPLDTLGWWGYYITMTAELISAVYTVLVHISFDLTVFGLMIFLSGQFLLLRKLTEGIAGRGRGYKLTSERDARAHYRIKRCHRTLKILDNSVVLLDNLVQNILGIYFLVATLTLCSVAMRLSTEEMSVMKVIPLVQYTGACLVQLFLFCYYGDMLLHRSSVGMGEGAFASAWWCLTPRLRREVLLLAAWQARSRRLRAGPFNRLDLPSFIQIVRAAYSYYAVLRK